MSAVLRPLTGDGSPPVQGSYPQAVEVTGAGRWLFLSGQVPVGPDGTVAADFRGQCEQVWDNLEIQLRAAGMTLDNLVKVTTFLASRDHTFANREVRLKRLDGRQPALTVVIAGLFEEGWLVEVEAVADA